MPADWMAIQEREWMILAAVRIGMSETGNRETENRERGNPERGNPETGWSGCGCMAWAAG